MTPTMTQIRVKPILLLLVGLILLGVVLPPLNAHALKRHDSGAVRAHSWVEQNGDEDCMLRCIDGRVRYVCPIDRPGNPLYAIVVISPLGDLITAFVCREKYAESVRAMEE